MTKSKPTNEMDGQELWSKLQKLGFSQMEFSRTIKRGGPTVRRWISGSYPVPAEIALLVNLMIKTKTTAEDLQG